MLRYHERIKFTRDSSGVRPDPTPDCRVALYRDEIARGELKSCRRRRGARTCKGPQMASDNSCYLGGFPNTPPWPKPLHGGATIGLKNGLPYLGVWHPPLKVIPADEITALYILPEITALYIIPAHWARSFRDVPR